MPFLFLLSFAFSNKLNQTRAKRWHAGPMLANIYDHKRPQWLYVYLFIYLFFDKYNGSMFDPVNEIGTKPIKSHVIQEHLQADSCDPC